MILSKVQIPKVEIYNYRSETLALLAKLSAIAFPDSKP